MSDMIFKTKDVAASELINTNMGEYSSYMADSKLPHIIDGLKKVHRRIIWKMGTESNELLVHKFMGTVLEIHPHGDQSVFGALIRLMQECSVGIPIVYGHGNTGGYASSSVSAPRYLKTKAAEIAKDLFFKGIHKDTIPMISTEDFEGMEPAYLIPKLPTALLLPNLTIGVGFKSVICPLNLNDLCELVKRFIDHKKSGQLQSPDFKKWAQYLIPDFPIVNYIRNKSELIEAYKNGDYDHPIVVDGNMQLNPNHITLETIPYGSAFDNMQETVIAELKNKKSWLADLFTSYNDRVSNRNIGEFKLNFKRSVDIFDILEDYKLLVKFSNNIKPFRNYINERKVIEDCPPPVLMERWYHARRKSILGGIKYDQSVCIKEIMIIKAKCIVADHKDEVIRIIKESNDVENCIGELMNKFELTRFQATVLRNSPLHTLSKTTKAELMYKIEELEAKAKNLTDSLSKYDDIIYDDACYFAKKYKRPRMTKTDEAIGYVCINKKGIIQFDSLDELFDILNTFRNSDNDIHIYKFNTKYKYLVNNNKMKLSNVSLPKQFLGSQIIESPTRNIHTLCFYQGTVSCIEGLHFDKTDNNEVILIPVTEKFTGIHIDGTLEEMNVSDMTTRKNIGKKGSKSTLINAIPHYYGDDDIIVVHMNTSNPDTIRFDKVKIGTTKKIVTTAMGDTIILGIIPLHDTNKNNNYIYTIPKSCNTTNIQYIQINDINIVDWKNEISTYIKLNRKIKRHSSLNTMAVL